MYTVALTGVSGSLYMLEFPKQPPVFHNVSKLPSVHQLFPQSTKFRRIHIRGGGRVQIHQHTEDIILDNIDEDSSKDAS